MKDEYQTDLFAKVFDLVQKSVDGTLSATEEEELLRLVCDDQAARTYYVKIISDTSMLQVWAESTQLSDTDGGVRSQVNEMLNSVDSPSSETTNIRPSRHRTRPDWQNHKLLRVVFVLSLFANIALAATWAVSTSLARNTDSLGNTTSTTTAVQVATLTGMSECDWGKIPTEPVVGMPLMEGQLLSMNSGLAEVTFESGVRLLVEGPARYVIESGELVYLPFGKLTGYVPPQATGFRVETPFSVLVDHGTQFGIEADPQGTTTAHVFEGDIEIKSQGKATDESTESRHLFAGESIRLEPLGFRRPNKVERQNQSQSTFVRELPTPETHASRYSHAIMQSQPIAYWRFENLSGQSIDDMSKNGNHAVIEPSVQVGASGVPATNFSGMSKFNHALVFPGESIRADRTIRSERLIADIPELSDDYSVEMWVYSTRSHEDRLISGYFFSRGEDGVNGENEGDHLNLSGTLLQKPGAISYFSGDETNQILVGESRLPPYTWHQLVFVRQNKNVLVYLDGALESTLLTDSSTQLPLKSNVITIGGRSDSEWNFRGKIDEVSVYDRPLSADEVGVHFKAAK